MKTILIILALLPFAIMADEAAKPKYPDIGIAELKEQIAAKKVTLLDANGSESFAKRSLPGAIDFAAAKDLAAVLPKEKDALIVAYCGSPQCTAYLKAADAAAALGYTNVKHFSAGIRGWLAETPKPKDPTATTETPAAPATPTAPVAPVTPAAKKCGGCAH